MERRLFSCHASGYAIELMDKRRREDIVVMLIDNFLRDETMIKSLRNSVGAMDTSETETKNLRDDERLLMETVVDAGTVLVAVHEETGRISGVVVILNYTRGAGELVKFSNPYEGRLKSRVIKDFFRYMGMIKLRGAELFEKYPDCRVYAEIELIGVNRLDRGKGIGLDLYKAALNVVQEMPEVSLLCGTYTCMYSKKIAERIGKKTVATVDLKLFRDAGGAPVFQDTEPHNIVALMAMEI